MSTKKTTTKNTPTKSTLLNSVEKITTTAKSINTQVVDTLEELVKDAKSNSTQISEEATKALKNIQVADSLKKVSTTMTNINAEALETAKEVLNDVYQTAKSNIDKIDLNINLNVAKNVEILQAAAKNANDFVIESTEDMIEEAVKSGEKWQDVMSKAVKNGTVLLGKQQELAIDTVEEVVNQYKTGNVRIKKLLGIKSELDTSFLKEQADKAAILAKQAKDKTVASIDEILDNAFDTFTTKTGVNTNITKAKTKQAIKDVVATAEQFMDKVADMPKQIKAKGALSVKKAAKVTKQESTISSENAIATTIEVAAPVGKKTAKAPKAAKAKVAKKENTISSENAVTTTIEIVQPVTKKTTKSTKPAKENIAKKGKTEQVVKAGTTTKVDDLKIVEGIGPKIEKLLNAAGIYTYKQLATTETATIAEILVAAGSSFKLHDPTTWSQQAELAAAGKWEVLEVWKSRLKGGKPNNSRVVVL